MKSQRWLLAPVLALVLAMSNFASAQVIDSTTFTGVMPDPNGVGDTHMYSLVNSGSMEALAFFGTITEINTATFGNEIEFSYSGSGVSDSNLLLTTAAGFTDSIPFQVVLPIDDGFGFPVGISASDNWTFDFFEAFDDGGDGLVDANVDVTFQWLESVPTAAETDLGDFTLNQGFYDRGGFGGPEDHPYAEIAFQVSADGIYSLESAWDGFDGYLYLFDRRFNEDDSNPLAFDDDFVSTASSRIESVSLQAGTTYYAAMTTFGGQADITDLQGDLRIGNPFGGTAFLVAIPEPNSGIAMVGLLAAVCLIRRRRK